jgi:hypothetical protein
VTGWKGATTVVDMQMHVDYAGAHKTGAHDPPKHGLIAICSLPRAFLFAARSGAKLITPSLLLKTLISHLSASSFLLNKTKNKQLSKITRIIPELFTYLKPVDYTSRVITQVVKTFSNLLNS